jgi:hypothetical protein
MINLQIQLNGAQVAHVQTNQGIVSIDIADMDNPPVFIVKDMQNGRVDTFRLAYKDGRWAIVDYSTLTD